MSTKGQAANGNSLEDQEKILLEHGCTEVYKESYTGTKTDRPVFNDVINRLEANDTLMVAKLDRFARTATEGIKLIRSLLERGVRVHILNMGLIEDTPTGRLILTVMAAFAEFERDMIIERTQAGKAVAKTKPGYREGRPRKYTDTQIEMALSLLDKYSYTQVERMTKISKSTLVREMRKRKLKTA